MMNELIEIAREFCEEDIELDEDTSILMDMELSSMEFFQLICSVEEKFNVHISERKLRKIDTLGDLYEEVTK